MPNKHNLGVYLAPQHDPSKWKEYLFAIDPAWIRVLMPGDAPADLISQIHHICPEADISLRWWDVDDGGESNKRAKYNDPEGSAQRDVDVYADRINQMENTAKRNGLPFPSRDQLWINTPNEPPSWEHDLRPKIASNIAAHFKPAMKHSLGVMACEFAVGHPEEWPPVWDWMEPAFAQLEMYGGIVSLHEYSQPEGPHYVWTDNEGKVREDWGALCGRYLHFKRNVPIVITEAGVDGRIYGRYATPDTGYLKFMDANAYARITREYLVETKRDPRIVGVLPFITDYHDNEWASFDTLHAKDAFVQMLKEMDRVQNPPSPGLPPVVNPGPSGTLAKLGVAIAEVNVLYKKLLEEQ